MFSCGLSTRPRRSRASTWTEGSKPPSVRPDIRLSVCAVAGLPDGTDLHRRGFAVPSVPVRLRGVAAARSRWVNSLPSRVGSLAHGFPVSDGDRRAAARTSSIGTGGLVAVPAPAVSDSGREPGRPSGRWGDFPRAEARESGSLCPPPCTLARQISASVGRSAAPALVTWRHLPTTGSNRVRPLTPVVHERSGKGSVQVSSRVMR